MESDSDSEEEEEDEDKSTAPVATKSNKKAAARSNKNGLPLHLEKHLLSDIEAAGGIQVASIPSVLNLPGKEHGIYPPPNTPLRSKIFKRTDYLKSLPREDYLQLLASHGLVPSASFPSSAVVPKKQKQPKKKASKKKTKTVQHPQPKATAEPKTTNTNTTVNASTTSTTNNTTRPFPGTSNMSNLGSPMSVRYTGLAGAPGAIVGKFLLSLRVARLVLPRLC